MRIHGLRCELLEDPLGIEEASPQLSWLLESDRRGAHQVAYQIMVASTPARLEGGYPDLWDSGRVVSTATAHVAYEGRRMVSSERAHWIVRVWDDTGGVSRSERACWEMGLLDRTDWVAEWIGRPAEWQRGPGRPTPLLRVEFELPRPVWWARLYVTALGIYVAHCNGHRIGRECFTPGWTDYGTRLQYQTYDVTGLLRPGVNALAAELADGWYAGYVGFLGREIYGIEPQLLAQLVIRDAEGATTTIVTDERWRVGTGGRLSADLLMGETFDAQLVPTGWTEPGFDDSRWPRARGTDGAAARLVCPPAPPSRAVMEIRPIGVTEPSPGRWVFDLDQNIAGWARLRTSGAAGTVVTLRFAEVLDGSGDLYTANLRSARASDQYTCAGGGDEVYEPLFTYHGFRYVEVTGLDAPAQADTVTGIVCSADLTPTGSFRCSDPLVDRLQQNIVWGQRGNFLEVPTDCPQRDERMGWAGDAQVFAPTACFNADVGAFLGKWMTDMSDGQSDDGAFPAVAPRLVGANPDEADGAPGWGDAGVVVPWVLFQRYGDVRQLRRCSAPMAAWVDHIHAANPDLLWRERRHGDMGDWLSLGSDSPKDVVATSFFARSARLVADAAVALGEVGDARRYGDLAARIRRAYQTAFVGGDGRIKGDSQTVYALAIRFDLLEPHQRTIAADRLRADVERRGWHPSAGFLGVAHLLPALSDTGHLDAAYCLLHQEEFPSWLYPVKHGATTIWERWDGWTEQAGFQDPAMNSFNHYAFGSVGEWLYETVAGIRPDPLNPGFVSAIIAPRPGGRLSWVDASYRSTRGRIAVRWEWDRHTFLLDLTLPPGCDAVVHLPADPASPIVESGVDLGEAPAVTVHERSGPTAILQVASGRYRFRSALTTPKGAACSS